MNVRGALVCASISLVLCGQALAETAPARAAATSSPPRIGLPKGYVFLRDAAPSIQQDMRYATPNNFTGSPLPGYGAAECILTRSAGEALAAVQQELAPLNLSLKVLDCYRPARAVRAMVAWVQNAGVAGDRRYFPRGQKSALIREGYIASQSGHSTGNVVDLTLAEAPATGDGHGGDEGAAASSCIAEGAGRNASIDMGTSFDCFDPRSNTDSGEITAAQAGWRQRLVKAMAHHGFTNYAREWWHFSHTGSEPRVDFVIPAYPEHVAPGSVAPGAAAPGAQDR